jgi:IS1 family transposase
LTYRIRENSFWAWLAAKRLKSEKMAMVLGHTIHLYNTTAEELLRNRRWLRHELAHIRQVEQLGRFRFLWCYVVESFRRGYVQNRFEVEARAAESDPSLDSFVFLPNARQAAREV